MRRILPFLLILLLPAALLPAQEGDPDFDIDQFETSIQGFADGVAASLPLNLAIGLNWSDAYIGQLLHFGVGVTAGGSTMPFESAKVITDALGVTETLMENPNFAFIEQYGMPLPAAAAEARIGGIIFPFDFGVKFGTVPPDVELNQFVPGMELDYLLAGFDIRVPVVKERGLIPEVSIGGGFNSVDATVGIGGLLGGDLTLEDVQVPTGYDMQSGEPIFESFSIEMSDPAAEFTWNAQSIDLKAQMSKRLFIITPYLGAGMSIGFGNAGGGLGSQVTILDSQGEPLSDEEIDALNDAASELGSEYTMPEIDPEQGFYLTAKMTPEWTFRAYGGLSVNLFFLKVDATLMYDFAGGYAASLGTRLQF